VKNLDYLVGVAIINSSKDTRVETGNKKQVAKALSRLALCCRIPNRLGYACSRHFDQGASLESV